MTLLEKSQIALEYDKILSELSLFAKTEQSKQLCLNLTPSADYQTIESELQYTTEAKQILDNALDIPIDYIQNFSALKKKNEYFVEEELFDIAKTLRIARVVKNFIKNNSDTQTLLYKFSEQIYVNKELEDSIFSVIDDNYTVRQNANIELSGLYSSLRDTENILKQTVRELMADKNFQTHLQENIYTLRDDRIVFQVKASSKSKISGIVHDVSATNRTFYIEPSQIVPLNNKIREVKSKIYAEVIRILTLLSNNVKKEMQNLEIMEKLLAKIDFHFAKARYALKIDAICPDLSKEKIIKIELMKHPLLIKHSENIIANNFEMGNTYRSVIITGSNTGGKTVTLKTVGIFVLMMKSGMFLPCAEAKIYPFKNILADIGDEQSIIQSLSTFSSHMTNIIEILKLSNEDSLVLIDELCAGTDPQEGAILAEVVLQDLAQKNVFSIITTHYGELKALEYSDSYFKNASVEFDTKTLKPTYKLTIGIPGLSNAIAISANLGMDEYLISKARKLLENKKDLTSKAVEKLQNTQYNLDANLKEAEELNSEAQQLKEKYEKELKEHKKEKNKTIKLLKDKFENRLANAKSEIKDILKEIREEKNEKIIRRSYSRLAKLEEGYLKEIQKAEEKEQYLELDWSKVRVGDKVMVKELNQQVEVLTLPSKNETLLIQMGLIKTKINKERLAVYNQELAKKTYLPNFSNQQFSLKKHDITNTLDLRGERVENALDKLDEYLDKASLANLSPVYIIHGHGTGALKSAVREYVKESPYVAKYRIGEDAEGGDGVCVIDIK